MKSSLLVALLLSSAAFAECPKWADAIETCPVVGPHEDVWREFYFEGTSEAHLVGILVHAGPKMVPSIIEVIRDQQIFARRYAISALGLLKQREALSALNTILNDESEKDYFRSDALQAIFAIDPGAGQLAASELLDDPEQPDDMLKPQPKADNRTFERVRELCESVLMCCDESWVSQRAFAGST